MVGKCEDWEVTVSKFMILYRAQTSTREQMANATPEQMQAGLEAWRIWATKVGYALTDLGAPFAHTTHVGPSAATTDVCGYSLLEAGSAYAGGNPLDGHTPPTQPRGS